MHACCAKQPGSISLHIMSGITMCSLWSLASAPLAGGQTPGCKAGSCRAVCTVTCPLQQQTLCYGWDYGMLTSVACADVAPLHRRGGRLAPPGHPCSHFAHCICQLLALEQRPRTALPHASTICSPLPALAASTSSSTCGTQGAGARAGRGAGRAYHARWGSNGSRGWGCAVSNVCTRHCV